jgi:hypothetical protein
VADANNFPIFAPDLSSKGRSIPWTASGCFASASPMKTILTRLLPDVRQLLINLKSS